MKRVLKRPQFLLDLAEELVWLNEKAGPNVAEAWHQSLKKAIHLLEDNPLIERVRKDLKPPGLRSWRIGGFPRWLIFYTIDQNKNLVLYRVRPGTMNIFVLKMKS